MAKKTPKPPSDAAIAKVAGEVSGTLTPSLLANKKLTVPEYGFVQKSEKKPCKWGFEKAFKPRVELEIVSGVKADKLGIEAGPAIRLCYAEDKPGPLVSVTTIKEGLDVGNKYLRCLKTDGDSPDEAKACGLKAAKGVSHTIAGLRRKSRR